MTHRKKISLLVMICFILALFWGCTSKEDKTGAAPIDKDKSPAMQVASPDPSAQATAPISPSDKSKIIVDVDGTKLTQKQLDDEIKKRINAMKSDIPAEKLKEFKAGMKDQVINDFIVRTLLANDLSRKKITATNQEIADAVESMKKTLPPGVTLDDLMKKNQINKEKMHEEIAFGISINKLVLSELAGKAKPTEKEISKFYKDNKDKFKIPETVQVRHILVSKAPGDDEKTRTEKIAKAESLRKQLLAGADFAEMAKKHSDCPSKENGGDLGVFTRGEMIKPFEDAAFAQEKNVIGPVVETNFGYHIIQVLDRRSSSTLALDETTKTKISSYLQQQKQQTAFEALVKKLRSKANVTVYRN